MEIKRNQKEIKRTSTGFKRKSKGNRRDQKDIKRNHKETKRKSKGTKRKSTKEVKRTSKGIKGHQKESKGKQKESKGNQSCTIYQSEKHLVFGPNLAFGGILMSEPQMAQCQSMHTVGFNSANLTNIWDVLHHLALLGRSFNVQIPEQSLCLLATFYSLWMGKKELWDGWKWNAPSTESTNFCCCQGAAFDLVIFHVHFA